MNEQAAYRSPAHTLQAVLKLGRLNILPGGLMAFGLGVAMAYGQLGSFDWMAIGAAAAVTVTANLAAHYADEYADLDTDSLTRRTFLSGGSGVLPAGTVPARLALQIAITLAAVSVAISIICVYTNVLPIVCLPIAWLGLLLGWFYSMRPLQLERHGWGEVVNGFIGGILMPLMGYAANGGSELWTAAAALLPIFLFVMANLMGIHWADREADAAVGKRSMVVILGARAVMAQRAFLLLAYLTTLALSGWLLPWTVTAAILATLPLAVWSWRQFSHGSSPWPGALLMSAAIAGSAMGWLAYLT